MISLSWSYLKERLLDLSQQEKTNSSLSKELSERFNEYGLENKLAIQNDELFFIFDPLPNRTDLACFEGLIREISIIENLPINYSLFQGKFNLETKQRQKSADILLSIKSDKKIKELDLIEKLTKGNKKNEEDNLLKVFCFLNLETGWEFKLKGKRGEKKIVKFFRLEKKASFFSLQEIINRLNSLLLKMDLDFELIPLKIVSSNKKPKIICLKTSFIEKKLGKKIDSSDIKKIWEKLNWNYLEKKGNFFVEIPIFCQGIKRKEDLLAEFLHFYGYQKILLEEKKSEINSLIGEIYQNQKEERVELKIIDFLINHGWQEIVTHSLVEKEFFAEENADNELRNPQNNSSRYYRSSLIPSHLKVIEYNFLRKNFDLFFFEISQVYDRDSKTKKILTLSATGSIIEQKFHNFHNAIDFFLLKGLLENILFKTGLNNIVFSQPEERNLLIDLKNLSNYIYLGKKIVGFLGSPSQKLLDNHKTLKKKKIFVAEISLTELFKEKSVFEKKEKSIKKVWDHPIILKDVSYFFPNNLEFISIIEIIKDKFASFLREVELTDNYQDSSLKKASLKVLTLRFFIQEENVLTKEEVAEKIKLISNFLLKKFSVSVQ